MRGTDGAPFERYTELSAPGKASRCLPFLRKDDDVILSKNRNMPTLCRIRVVHSAVNRLPVITPPQLAGVHSQNEEATRAHICQSCQVATEGLELLIVAPRPSPRTNSAFGVRRQDPQSEIQASSNEESKCGEVPEKNENAISKIPETPTISVYEGTVHGSCENIDTI